MDKVSIMKENGSFNEKYKKVTAPAFGSGIFFDPRDIVQVKYEMLRCVSLGEATVTQAADQFGFSREAFYNNKNAYELGGVQALFPKKTGPKGPHKLVPEAIQWIDAFIQENPRAHVSEINGHLRENMGISVHNRTIERYLSKKHPGSR